MNPPIEVQYATVLTDMPTSACFDSWVRAIDTAVTRHGALTIRLVDEAEGLELNRRFRGRDGATNVLSFAFEPMPGLPEDQAVLGDLVICAPVVAREADQQGKSVRAHHAHMAIHGTLHLLGYDHLTEDDAVRMERIECEILAGLCFSNPYELHTERNGRATG